MPIVQIEMRAGKTLDQKREMVKNITDGIVSALKCSPDAVTIIIRDMSKESYAKAGKLDCDQ